MKKYILILSIAIIAVLNFTLVKSKTGEVTLKSLTELAQANADECAVGTIRQVKQNVVIYVYEIYTIGTCPGTPQEYCGNHWTITTTHQSESYDLIEEVWTGTVWVPTGNKTFYHTDVIIKVDNPGCPRHHFPDY